VGLRAPVIKGRLAASFSSVPVINVGGVVADALLRRRTLNAPLTIFTNQLPIFTNQLPKIPTKNTKNNRSD
jgi:hypothetical protein